MDINNIQKSLNSLTTTQQDLDCSDYQIIKRSTNESLKYNFTIRDKKINILNKQQDPESIRNIPIVCSFADMEFKFSPQIYKRFNQIISSSGPHFGYPMQTKQTLAANQEWVRKRYYKNVDSKSFVNFTNMLSLYHSVIFSLTNKDDEILIFTPTYYRFLFTLKESNRKIIEQQFSIRDTPQGKQIYIDIEALQELFKNNNIKLLVFINPANPSGRIFSKQELQGLKDILIKYKCKVFTDQIYGDSVVDVDKFTPLLSFQDLHPYLIWGNSYGKAFNCSGNSYAYCVVPNQEMRSILANRREHEAAFPTMFSLKLMESCYTVGQEWRIKTAKYIRRNYQLLKDQCEKHIPKLKFFTLDSSYLSVADFSEFGWKYSQIKHRLESQNIFATYFDGCYVYRDKETIFMVRFNLAMNIELIKELANRLIIALQQ